MIKPLLERKRRARINKCLDELKDLMVSALQKDGESITKLEKADVLELTVRHLRKLKSHGALGLRPSSSNRYLSGDSLTNSYPSKDHIYQCRVQLLQRGNIQIHRQWSFWSRCKCLCKTSSPFVKLYPRHRVSLPSTSSDVTRSISIIVNTSQSPVISCHTTNKSFRIF